MTQNTDRFLRQRTIVSPAQLAFPIEVCGAGGVGSLVSLVLGKIGCRNVTVTDFDTVAVHNLPSQLYAEHQVGQAKVHALAETVAILTGLQITPVTGKYQDLPPSGAEVIICAVDSLSERKKIWNAVRTYPNVKLFLDCRMGGDTMRIITIDMKKPTEHMRYEKILASTTKPHVERCTERAIAYNTFAIAAFVGNIIKKYAKEEALKAEFLMDFSSLAYA